MRPPIVFLAAGQGSQHYQMGRELFSTNAVFKAWLQRLDVVARDVLGSSVIEELYRPDRSPAHRFERTLDSHPAIFMVEYALSRAFEAAGILPEYVVGASLGEFAAMAISGALDPEVALEAVLRQAELIERDCPAGGMIAVLASPALFEQERATFHQCELAGVNFATNFVVSGGATAIRGAAAQLTRTNVSHSVLPVTRGFHSASIDAAREPYGAWLDRLTYREPRALVVSSALGGPLARVPRHFLWDVVRQPMRFPDALRALLVDLRPFAIDLSPGGTLATLSKYIPDLSSRLSVRGILSPFGGDRGRFEGACDARGIQ